MSKSFKIILLIIATTAAVFGYSAASKVDTISLVNSNVFKVVSAESKGGHATAFAITQGYLVTANHVCEMFRSKEYMKIEGLGFKKILATDSYNDLCILEGDKKVKGLKLTAEYKEFEAVFSINFQGEYAVKSLHYGNVSQKKTFDDLLFKIETQEQFEECLVRGRVVSNNVVALCLGEFEGVMTSVFGEPGASGSPMTNLSGEVVGVNKSITSKSSELIFIESKIVLELIKNMNKK